MWAKCKCICDSAIWLYDISDSLAAIGTVDSFEGEVCVHISQCKNYLWDAIKLENTYKFPHYRLV